MMNRARQKLNSSSGASLLLAMLFFLFCFTIGAIVLTAATANAGKTAHIREEQQSYLAVQSAARLLRNDLNGMTLQGSYTDTDTSSYSVTVDPDGNSTSTPSSSTSSRVPNLPATLSDSGLRTLLEKDLIDFFFGNNSVPGYAKPSQPKEYRLNLAAGDQLPEVFAVLTLHPEDYSIVIRLADANGAHPMTITFDVAQKNDQSTAITDNSSDSTLPDGSTVTDYETVTETTYLTEIVWSDGFIVKGD